MVSPTGCVRVRRPGRMTAAAGLLALLLTAAPGAGAAAPRQHGIGREGGAIPDVVTALCRDHTGLLWVGSRDGLLLYDGQTVRVFEHDASDPASISDNAVRAIHEDREGDLWIGTNSGGLNRLDRAGWRFERLRHDPADLETLSHDSVYAIQEDGDGALWVGTQRGLNRRDPKTGRFERFIADPAGVATGALGNDYILAIHRDGRGRMWFGTLGGGLYRWEPGAGAFTAFRHDPGNPRSLADDGVTAILDDPAGALWVGTVNGLDRMDPEDGSFRHSTGGADRPGTAGVPLVKALAPGRPGRMWVGTHTVGLYEVDLATGVLGPWPGDRDDCLPLGSSQIETLLGDGGGALWVATWGGGLRRLSASALVLCSEARSAALPAGLTRDAVTGIMADARGRVWFGTEAGDLVRVDTRGGARQGERSRPLPGAYSIFGMTEDGAGRLWCGTSRGLLRLSVAAGAAVAPGAAGAVGAPAADAAVMELRHDPADPSSIGPGYVRVVMIDRQGRIWIGTGEGGVQRLDADGRVVERLARNPADPHSLSDNYVTAIHEDAGGTLWVGTRSGGLNALDPDHGSFARFAPDPDDPASLGHHCVTFLHEDRAGRLWVGTAGGGLNLVERRAGGTPRFRRFTEDDGLVDNDVMAILEDDDGSLWLATRHGLARFDPSTAEFLGLHASDGLPTEEFEAGVAGRDRDRLYFSTIKGPIAIPAGTPLPARVPSPLIVRSIRTPDGEVRGDRPAWNLDHLDVPYGAWLAIELAVLDYAAEPRHRYAYRLEGDWVDLGTVRTITFTGLRPGQYPFAARGRNTEGVWSAPTPDLRLRVVPPFWLTGWFRAAALLAVIGLAFVGHRARLLAVERRNRALVTLHEQRERAQRELTAAYERLRLLTGRLEAAKEDERRHIARELHDELGPSLTAVIINLQLLLRGAAAPGAASRIRDAIAIVDRLVQRVRDLSLDLRPPLLDELGLPAALRGYLEVQAERAGLEIPVEIGSAVEGLPPAIEIHAFRVVQEAVTNAVRHAAASRIAVGVERRDGGLLLEVRDDGRGFDVTKAMESTAGKALGLLGMHERIRSLGGTIAIDSAPARGTVVRARIPLGGAS